MQYSGIVQKGSKRATALGFPTVNIPLTDEKISGIYAAKVKVGEEEYEAVAYADRKGKKLEAHIFDFSADLYGWNIRITLLYKLRDDRKFNEKKDARKQIATDAQNARVFFRRGTHPSTSL